MVDSGSSFTYIKTSLANKLKLYIIPTKKTVPLADSNLSANIRGEVVTDVEMNGHLHKGVVVGVIDSLCVDMIVGKDFMRQHKKVIMNFNGPREELVLGAIPKQSSSLPPMDVPPPPLFTHLSDNIKPVATKARKHTPADFRFLKEQVAELRKNGIIRHSVSPWRAQPFVTKDSDTHKRRMVIDYSNTINMFTELDAYPIPDLLKMVQNISR